MNKGQGSITVTGMDSAGSSVNHNYLLSPLILYPKLAMGLSFSLESIKILHCLNEMQVPPWAMQSPAEVLETPMNTTFSMR